MKKQHFNIEETAENWLLLAHKILASVLADKGAASIAYEYIGSNTHFFPTKEQAIWTAVLQCLDEGIPSLVDAVSIRMTQDSGYARIIANQFNEIDNLRLKENLEVFISLSRGMYLRALGNKLSEVNPADYSGDVKHLLTGIETTLTDTSDAIYTMDDISRLLDDMLTSGKFSPVPTGIGWIDKSLGGFHTSMNFWVVAPYKSYKTSIARNICLNAARSGIGIGFMAAEGTKAQTVLDFRLMIATEYLIKIGYDFRDINLDSKLVLNAANGNGYLNDVEKQALDYAKEELSDLPVFVYDATDNITDLITLKHKIKYLKRKHDIKMVWIDYSQLFGDPSQHSVERADNVARAVQNYAVLFDVAMCAISQQNEEAVKGNNKSHSPGVKGGGGAPAAADGLFISSKDAEDNHTFYLQAKLGRRFPPSEPHTHYSAKSGLIVDRYISGV